MKLTLSEGYLCNGEACEVSPDTIRFDHRRASHEMTRFYDDGHVEAVFGLVSGLFVRCSLVWVSLHGEPDKLIESFQ